MSHLNVAAPSAPVASSSPVGRGASSAAPCGDHEREKNCALSVIGSSAVYMSLSSSSSKRRRMLRGCRSCRSSAAKSSVSSALMPSKS
eukprot:3979924-Pyramimonas_sp.AAC.1